MNTGTNKKRGGKPKALAEAAGKVTKSVFGRRGLADGAVINDWPTIAGAHLARHSAPERIVFRTGERREGDLHLRVDNGGLAMELQHLEPVLLERINGYFGYFAVAHIKITQGPLPERKESIQPVEASLSPSEEETLLKTLAKIDDPELKAALEKLGRGVLRHK